MSDDLDHLSSHDPKDSAEKKSHITTGIGQCTYVRSMGGEGGRGGEREDRKGRGRTGRGEGGRGGKREDGEGRGRTGRGEGGRGGEREDGEERGRTGRHLNVLTFDFMSSPNFSANMSPTPFFSSSSSSSLSSVPLEAAEGGKGLL